MTNFSANDITRRGLLTGIAALAAAAVLPRGAFALDTNQAAALVSGLAGEITRVINSGARESAMYDEFERIFVKYADVPTIAVSVLGPPARTASRAQLAAYTQAFQGYIARKYGKRFREFIGGEIIVKDARPLKSFYEVRCVANLRNEAPFDFTFLVSNRSGQDKFFDMLVEGVSLLKTEKTEVGAMLDRRGGNIDALIADLKTAG